MKPNAVDWQQPFFVGGFGASAIGIPHNALDRVAKYLLATIRESNVDVLFSKGLSSAPLYDNVSNCPGRGSEYDISDTDKSYMARDDSALRCPFFVKGSCAYKPRYISVLHRGGNSSNFGSKHIKNSKIVCGLPDPPRYFVTNFTASPNIEGSNLYRICQ